MPASINVAAAAIPAIPDPITITFAEFG